MIDCREIDTTIAIAMSKIERMLDRVHDMNDLVFVMTPDIFCSLIGRKEFFTSVDTAHENGVMGMYYGLDVFVVDTRTCDESICTPAFRYQECVNVPIQAGDYFLFKDCGALYKSNDGERIYDTGIRVTNGIERETIRPMADTVFEAGYITSPYITSSYTPTNYSSWRLFQSDFAWKSPYEGWCASDIFKMPKKKVEPELETTNEFDEFIAQFKRN